MLNSPLQTFFATCPKNLETLLENELISLGAIKTKQTVAGVRFSGDLALAYRACMWSRIANRILLPLISFEVKSAETLYGGVKVINWSEHLLANATFAVDFKGESKQIKNTHFGALKVKDAIVDQIRQKTGTRPTIDTENPDIRINVFLDREIATISIDLSGESLHRRGYRVDTGVAPMKENLAAAIIQRTFLCLTGASKNNFPSIILDPMCGSGTILIEAAMIMSDIAPGLYRKKFGFTKWLKHQNILWEKICADAKNRREIGLKKLKPIFFGYDIDPRTIGTAKLNIERAGFAKYIFVTVKEITKFTPPTHDKELAGKDGLIITNPPYGVRLEDETKLQILYADFGKVLQERFLGWQVAVFTGNPNLAKFMRIRAQKQYNFFNGSIPCKLLLFTIAAEHFFGANIKNQKLEH